MFTGYLYEMFTAPNYNGKKLCEHGLITYTKTRSSHGPLEISSITLRPERHLMVKLLILKYSYVYSWSRINPPLIKQVGTKYQQYMVYLLLGVVQRDKCQHVRTCTYTNTMNCPSKAPQVRARIPETCSFLLTANCCATEKET